MLVRFKPPPETVTIRDGADLDVEMRKAGFNVVVPGYVIFDRILDAVVQHTRADSGFSAEERKAGLVTSLRNLADFLDGVEVVE